MYSFARLTICLTKLALLDIPSFMIRRSLAMLKLARFLGPHRRQLAWSSSWPWRSRSPTCCCPASRRTSWTRASSGATSSHLRNRRPDAADLAARHRGRRGRQLLVRPGVHRVRAGPAGRHLRAHRAPVGAPVRAVRRRLAGDAHDQRHHPGAADAHHDAHHGHHGADDGDRRRDPGVVAGRAAGLGARGRDAGDGGGVRR